MRIASSMEIEDDELRAYVDEALGIGPATWGHRSDGGDRSTGDGSHDRLDSEFDDWECAGDRSDDGPAAERLSKKRRGTRHTPSSSLEKDWKLVKGETDSNIEGMESHIARAMAQSLPKQPWESSPAAKVFNPDYLKGPGYMRVGLSDALLGNVARSSSPPRPVPRAIPEFVARRLRMASLNKSDDCLRSGALMKARSLLLYDPPATQLGQSLLNAAGTLIDENQVTQSLIDAFAPKSTNTLVKRFSSLWRFARWCSAKYIPPLQMAEDTVYDYLCHLRDEKASASAASSFLEAVSFLHSVACIRGLGSNPQFSGRCKGLARSQLQTRRKRKQASPLTVEMVRALEDFTARHFQSHLAVISGHLLFCIYSCARWADSIRLTEIEQFHRGRITLIETSTTRHKTALSDEARTQVLPYVCLGQGISDFPWSQPWLAARTKFGLDIQVMDDQISIPSWSDSQEAFTSLPMSSTEATLWAREILELAGVPRDQASMVSSHSCKATLLSWTSKSGSFSRAERRLLGHHYDREDRSFLIYSRDTYAPLAVKIRLMLDRIANGKFCPDLSRVDRIAQAVDEADNNSASEVSDPTDSNASREDPPSPSTKLIRSLQPAGEWPQELEGVMPDKCLIRRISRVVHVALDLGVKLRCGRKVTSNYLPLSRSSLELSDFQVCAQCRTTAPPSPTVLEEESPPEQEGSMPSTPYEPSDSPA